MPQSEITRYTNRAQDFTPITQLEYNQFAFASLTYPIDMNDLSHAMLFNINVQRTSSDFSGGRETADETFTGTIGNAFGLGTTRNQRAAPPSSPGLTRRTRRALRAISLYVPETVVFEDRQQYDTPNLTQTLGIAGTMATTAGSSLLARGTEQPGIASAAAGGVAALGSLVSGILRGGDITSAISRANRVTTDVARSTAQFTGYALNPVIEVLYNSPVLRSFNFDFVFTPKSSKEADMVWSIIYEFRRHSAPEYASIDGVAAGLFFLPPSDFDITFLRRESTGSFTENTNVPRISSCVLKSVQVDYAASGQFSTFIDGMPIQIRMRLEFQELNILTRDRIDKGY